MANPDQTRPPLGENHKDYLTRGEIDDIVEKAVRHTLITMGIEATDPIEMQKDFQALREWRSSIHSIKSKSVMTMVGIAATGFLGLLWIGIQHVFGKN